MGSACRRLSGDGPPVYGCELSLGGAVSLGGSPGGTAGATLSSLPSAPKVAIMSRNKIFVLTDAGLITVVIGVSVSPILIVIASWAYQKGCPRMHPPGQ
jgi:hypothetical protein